MSGTAVWNLITVFTVEEPPNDLKNRREKTSKISDLVIAKVANIQFLPH